MDNKDSIPFVYRQKNKTVFCSIELFYYKRELSEYFKK